MLKPTQKFALFYLITPNNVGFAQSGSAVGIKALVPLNQMAWFSHWAAAPQL